MIVGNEPIVIGQFKIACPEFMFVQDMPISMPRAGLRIPAQLRCFEPLVNAAMEVEWLSGHYVYLTAKHFYATTESAGRPGWHLDGFGVSDISYVWSDSSPTEFCIQHFDLSSDCDISMQEMEEQAHPKNIRTYAVGSLLRLDATVVHRVPAKVEPGIRTFAKVSFSEHQYRLEGNAHNYLFDYDWPMVPRNQSRNHPARSIA